MELTSFSTTASTYLPTSTCFKYADFLLFQEAFLFFIYMSSSLMQTLYIPTLSFLLTLCLHRFRRFLWSLLSNIWRCRNKSHNSDTFSRDSNGKNKLNQPCNLSHVPLHVLMLLQLSWYWIKARNNTTEQNRTERNTVHVLHLFWYWIETWKNTTEQNT